MAPRVRMALVEKANPGHSLKFSGEDISWNQTMCLIKWRVASCKSSWLIYVRMYTCTRAPFSEYLFFQGKGQSSGERRAFVPRLQSQARPNRSLLSGRKLQHQTSPIFFLPAFFLFTLPNSYILTCATTNLLFVGYLK